MSEYRLSRRAETDLLAVYKFTAEKFGLYQAEAYHAGFERSFSLLAEFPRIGSPAEELGKSIFRFRFQSHYIFYTEEPGHVLVRALFHTAMNLRASLFD